MQTPLPPYTRLVQMPFFCAPACLQMILFRRGYGLRDQEDIALELGVKVTQEVQKNLRVKLEYAPPETAGIETILADQRINEYFSRNRIPLVARSVRASQIRTLGQWVSGHLQARHDLWLEYHADAMCGSPAIHDSLIESCDRVSITVVDPSWDQPGRHTHSIDVVAEAIGTKYGRETGIIVVKQK